MKLSEWKRFYLWKINERKFSGKKNFPEMFQDSIEKNVKKKIFLSLHHNCKQNRNQNQNQKKNMIPMLIIDPNGTIWNEKSGTIHSFNFLKIFKQINSVVWFRFCSMMVVIKLIFFSCLKRRKVSENKHTHTQGKNSNWMDWIELEIFFEKKKN